MATVKQTAFRLTQEDLAIIDAAKQRLGLADRTETLRYLLRQWPGSTAVLDAMAARREKTERNIKRPTKGSRA